MENEKEIPKSSPSTEIEAPQKSGVTRTYAEDLAYAMDHVEGDLIKKIIKEQEQIGEEQENLSPQSKKNKVLMIVSGVLILSAVVLFFLLANFGAKIFTITLKTQSTPLIFADKSQFLPVDGLSKDEIIQKIKSGVSNTIVKNGGIEAIYLTEGQQIVGLKRFIKLIKANVPLEMSDYTTENFMIGAFNGNTKDLFILIKVNSFTDVFPGIKAWENKMFSDIGDLFGTPTNIDTNYLLTKDFEDEVVGNKNARVLNTNDGKPVLKYVFANDTSVIVIANDEAVNEIMLRLSAGQIRK
ncbi:MAG: hypothetical protein NTZ44_01110 [Candidatus Nomurabacteria bacterium]|nr:hypothetical protein [Candidatus Nomurabacteria bacterium]